MAESSIIIFLIGALLVFEYQQQRTIKIKAKSSPIKYLIAVVAAIFIVVLFWSTSIQSNIKLIVIAILFASVAFFDQGLGETKVVTYGSLSKASNYGRYDRIIIEDMNKGTMMTFSSKKGGGYSLIFDEDSDVLYSFVKEYVPKNVRILSGEEYEKEIKLKDEKQGSLRERQLEMIRNRPQRNKFVRSPKKKA